VLLAVAHGSRDPRSAATVRALARTVGTYAPGLEVRAAFLDLSAPRVDDVLARLHAERHRPVVAVPLLLGRAYHARVDLPGTVARATDRLPGLRVRTADVLGADPGLEALALDRLRAVGADPADPGLGVVLAAVGSSHAPANAAVTGLAREWQARHRCRVEPAFVTGAAPDVPTAIASLIERGVRRVAVASWFLAPGLLPDHVRTLATRAAPGTAVADPLGDDPRVARAILRRYAEQCGARPPAARGPSRGSTA
jgi:sirohydrochlorin ferrochelatase